MRIAGLVFAIGLLVPAAPAAENGYLYRATLVQAAPGKLLELIDLYKSAATVDAEGGDESPVWMRHSQGDRWDLLLLYPMGSYAEFYRLERVGKRQKAQLRSPALAEKIRGCIAWQEDIFVYGPPLGELRGLWAKAGFFHVEMFEALPGRLADLYKQREMENSFLGKLGLPQNSIFVREQGAAWDLFTIGFYRDLKHYAESADIPEAKQEVAARAAGFEGANRIGPYLRTLISQHHDTLAVAVSPDSSWSPGQKPGR